MKKTLLILAFVSSIFAINVFAQHNNSIKVAPVDMVRAALGMTYERALPNNTSLILTGRYTNFTRIDNNELSFLSFIGILEGERYTQKGFDAELSFRKYFNGKATLNGFYLQPGLGIGQYEVSYSGDALNFLGFDIDAAKLTFVEDLDVSNFSLRSGYQWAFGSGFVLDMGVGMRANKTFSKSGSLPDSKRLNGFKGMGNLKLGYAF